MAEQKQDTNQLVSQSQQFEKKKNCTIFVGDLDPTYQEMDIIKFFHKYGGTSSVTLKKDPMTEQSKCYCFIEFTTEEGAQKAIREANGVKFGSKIIRVVQYKNPREIDISANIFLSKVDKTLSNLELTDYFSKFGKVISLKIVRDSKGASLGYGYLQYNTVEETDKVIAQQIHEISNKTVELCKYVNKDKKDSQEKKNLYVTQIPSGESNTQQSVESTLKEQFNKFGEADIKLQKDAKQRYYAFITYKDQEQASKAKQELHLKNIFNSEEPISVVYPQKREERFKESNQQQLYANNLKTDVTEEQIQQLFSEEFGEVTHVKVTESQAHNKQEASKCAFITFKNADEAEFAQFNSYENKKIKKLFIKSSVIIKFSLSNQEKEKYQMDVKYTQKKQQQKIGYMPMSMGMGIPPMAMGMPPMNMVPPFMQYNMGQQQKFQHQGKLYKNNSYNGNYNNNNNYNNNKQNYQRRNHNNQNHNQVKKYHSDQNRNHQNQHQNKPKTGYQQQSKEVNQMENFIKKLEAQAALGDEEKNQVWKQLGTQMFPQVQKVVGDQKAAKITGMLVDLQTYTIREIVETLNDPLQISQQVKEANELLEEAAKQQQN